MKAESNNMKLRWDGYIIIPRHALLILNDTKQFPESSRIKVVIITENVRSYGYRKFSSRTKWNCCNLQRRLFHSGKNSNGSFFSFQRMCDHSQRAAIKDCYFKIVLLLHSWQGSKVTDNTCWIRINRPGNIDLHWTNALTLTTWLNFEPIACEWGLHFEVSISFTEEITFLTRKSSDWIVILLFCFWWIL